MGSTPMNTSNVYSKRKAKAGNCLFASTSLSPGELIFSIDRPFIAVPDTPRLGETCSNCFVWIPANAAGTQGDGNDHVSLSACAGCHTVHYCSKGCQIRSWKAHHKHECKLYAKLHPRILPTVARAAVRFLRLLKDGEMHRKEQAGLTLLESHLDDFEKAGGERWETLCLMAKGVREYSETVCNETTVREVVGRVLINSLTLVNPTYDPIGICIDPLAATMNHSCNPNAVVSFDGPSLNVRSLRDIGADEEVFISYVDITNNPWRRQKELCERYFFGCDCAECKAGTILQSSAVPSGDEPFLSIESHAVDLLDSAKTSVYAENAVKALEQGMLLVRDSGVCPVFRQPYASLRQQLAVSFVAAQEWISAFAQMLKIYFEIDPILFPQPFHPVRIVHKWTLAKLVLHIAFLSVGEPGSVEKLAPYYLNYATVLWALLMEVEGNVYKSHGPETRFATMVRRKVEQVKVDMTRGDAAIPKLGKAELETQWSALRKVAHELAN